MGHCVQFISNLSPSHWSAIQIIFCYLQFIQAIRVTYFFLNNLWLEGYINMDWANDVNTQKSASSYIFLLQGKIISWQCHKQMTKALFSAKNIHPLQ
jgi:hypothetical protein